MGTSNHIEILKINYLGQMGHLGIRTNSIARAIYYLEKRGFSVDMSTAKYKGENLMQFI